MTCSLCLTIVVINVKEMQDLDNLVLAQFWVSLLGMHPNTPILSCIALGGESGVFTSISICKRKRAHKETKNYKSEFLQAGKNEVIEGLGWQFPKKQAWEGGREAYVRKHAGPCTGTSRY